MQIGQKIRDLRVLNQLTQEELANRCELSKGFISRVRKRSHIAFYCHVNRYLTMPGNETLKNFSATTKKSKLSFTKKISLPKKMLRKAKNIWWIVPNAQRNMMEPILTELLPGAQTGIGCPS